MGLSGPAATYPCHCSLTGREQMQKPRRSRDKAAARVLSSIQRDHADFVKEGANLKKEAQYHNAAHASVLNIPVHATCPPYLHVPLGVVKKHHNLLEAACHKLDVDIAIDRAKEPGNLSDQLFDNYVLAVREKAKLQAEIAKLNSRIDDMEENSPLAAMLRNATKIGNLKAKKLNLSQRLDTLCKRRNLKVGSGPVAATALMKHCKNTIFRGKGTMANHLPEMTNKFLQKNVYRDVCASIISRTEELTQSFSIRAEATAVTTKFNSLFTMYSKIHKLILHAHPVNGQQLTVIQDHMDEYLAYYRGILPGDRIIIKQHLLEDHVVPWMGQWGFGLGPHLEQG